MANTFRKIYKKTGNSGSSSDYQLVGNVGVNGVELDIMTGASSSTAGEIGLVPKPTAGQQDYLLTGAGSWQNISKYLGATDISDIGDGTVKGAISSLNERKRVIAGSAKVDFTDGEGWIPFSGSITNVEPVFTTNLVRTEVQSTEWIVAVNPATYKSGYLEVYLNTKSTFSRWVQYICVLQD